MPTATSAMVLCPRPDELEVDLRCDPSSQRLKKGRPTGAALILRGGREERCITSSADEGPIPMLVVQRTGPGTLGSLLEEDVIRSTRKETPPLLITLLQLGKVL